MRAIMLTNFGDNNYYSYREFRATPTPLSDFI